MFQDDIVGKKVLSISIAAYNIEKYVKNTLSSFVIEEIMDDVEIIIVNDGSKDRTLDLAMQFVKKYPGTFVIIDKDNGGYGSTINASTQKAVGKYFKTVDGDDWVERDGFIKLVEYLKHCDDDVVITNYKRVSDKNGKSTSTMFLTSKYETSMVFDDIYQGQELYMQSITIKTSILKEMKLKITEHCFYTDIEYILTPVPFINTISFLNEYVYMYRISVNEQSMSMKGKRKHIDEQFHVLKKMIDYYCSWYGKMSLSKQRYFEVILSGMVKSHVTAILSLPVGLSSYNRLKSFNQFLKEKNKKIYLETNKYKTVYLLRKFRYLYWPGNISYKIYQIILQILGR